MEQLLTKEKVRSHVCGTIVIIGLVLILGASHIAAILGVPAVITAMGVAAVAAVAAVPTVPEATQVKLICRESQVRNMWSVRLRPTQ